LKTAYLWEEITTPRSLADIIENYAAILKERDEKSGRVKETPIFPRFHQLGVVRALGRRQQPRRRAQVSDSTFGGQRQVEFDCMAGSPTDRTENPRRKRIGKRAILLGCPERVCCGCGAPLTRNVVRGTKLDPDRSQARRALELWEEHGLTDAHLGAIRATGICDAGKSLQFQSGAGRSAPRTAQLAAEAKTALGGYFREFTFAQMEMRGFCPCPCGETRWKAGFVLDPFAGTGTTLRAAHEAGRASAGRDLNA